VKDLTSTQLPNPVGLALSPNGDQLYVTLYGSDAIDVIDVSGDAQNGAITGSITGLSSPGGVAVAPNGELLYVTDEGTDTVDVVDISSDANHYKIVGMLADPGDVLIVPSTLALSPNGDTLYIANAVDGAAVAKVSGVSLTSPSAGSVSSTLIEGPDTEDGIFGLPVAPDGETLYIGDNGGSGSTISVADLSGDASSGKVVGTITDSFTPFENPSGVALTPNGQQLRGK
jgi:DNA-binding beta-propeller fold protein YncE